MKSIIICASLIFSVSTSTSAFASETTCIVKGMHCTACKEMVEGKLCDEAKFSTCDVKITDAKQELATIHLVTKDAAAKIDEKMVGAVIEDSGYKLEKCTAKDGKPAKSAKPSKAS